LILFHIQAAKIIILYTRTSLANTLLHDSQCAFLLVIAFANDAIHRELRPPIRSV